MDIGGITSEVFMGDVIWGLNSGGMRFDDVAVDGYGWGGWSKRGGIAAEVSVGDLNSGMNNGGVEMYEEVNASLTALNLLYNAFDLKTAQAIAAIGRRRGISVCGIGPEQTQIAMLDVRMSAPRHATPRHAAFDEWFSGLPKTQRGGRGVAWRVHT